jgi:hypothetical protein
MQLKYFTSTIQNCLRIVRAEQRFDGLSCLPRICSDCIIPDGLVAESKALPLINFCTELLKLKIQGDNWLTTSANSIQTSVH